MKRGEVISAIQNATKDEANFMEIMRKHVREIAVYFTDDRSSHVLYCTVHIYRVFLTTCMVGKDHNGRRMIVDCNH